MFRAIVEKVGGESAKSIICHTMEEIFAAVIQLNYPVVVRPSFTMGGLGSGIAFNEEELSQIAGAGLRHSCLLYTSPSPRDRQKSRMPSSA